MSNSFAYFNESQNQTGYIGKKPLRNKAKILSEKEQQEA
jgi:hypothetical protein